MSIYPIELTIINLYSIQWIEAILSLFYTRMVKPKVTSKGVTV